MFYVLCCLFSVFLIVECLDGFDYPSSDEEGQDDNQKAAAEEHLRHWSGASVRQQKELGIPDHTKIDYDGMHMYTYACSMLQLTCVFVCVCFQSSEKTFIIPCLRLQT